MAKSIFLSIHISAIEFLKLFDVANLILIIQKYCVELILVSGKEVLILTRSCVFVIGNFRPQFGITRAYKVVFSSTLYNLQNQCPLYEVQLPININGILLENTIFSQIAKNMSRNTSNFGQFIFCFVAKSGHMYFMSGLTKLRKLISLESVLVFCQMILLNMYTIENNISKLYLLSVNFMIQLYKSKEILIMGTKLYFILFHLESRYTKL